jgi:regulator of replication initiation timing
MSTELRLKVGQDEPATIWAEWTVEDVSEAAKIQVNVDGQDTLRILVNGYNVAMVKLGGQMAFDCHLSDTEKDEEIEKLEGLSAEYWRQVTHLQRENYELLQKQKGIERLKAQNEKFSKENADMRVENHELRRQTTYLREDVERGLRHVEAINGLVHKGVA